jgi:hypothetical protein
MSGSQVMSLKEKANTLLKKQRLPEPQIWAEWQKICHKLYQTQLNEVEVIQLRNFAKQVRINTDASIKPKALCMLLAKNMTDYLNIKNQADVAEIQQHLSVLNDPFVIERELLREHLYGEIISWVVIHVKKLKIKDAKHLILRYIFNKIISRQQTDDPVFVTTQSELAEAQLRKDFKYSKIPINAGAFIQELENRLKWASDTVKSTQLNPDLKVSRDYSHYLHYADLKYYDINHLAKNNPAKMSYIVALNIRYTYLHLSTHGLANMYSKKWGRQDGTEAFASVFNHYFDKYATAFPDLEAPFGSIGSFFEVKHWTTEKVFVNPPFDESLMAKVGHKIMKDLEVDPQPRKFIITLPNWKDMEILKELKSSPWLVQFKEYNKGELPFIDYMAGKSGKIIYPADIIEIHLSNRSHLQNLQTVHQLHQNSA